MNATERAAWISARREYLGATELADITLARLGLRGYASPFQIYQQKVGLAEPEPEKARGEWGPLEFGSRQESIVAEWYSEASGYQVEPVPEVLRHPEYPFLGANIDRRIVGERAGLECKTADKFEQFKDEKWGSGTDEDDDRVPPRHFIQCSIYLAITEWEWWALAALFGGNHPRKFRIEPDKKIIADVIAIGVDFWRNNVEKRIPPAAVDSADLRRKWKDSIGGSMLEVDSRTADLVSQYREAKAEQKAITEKASRLQAEIGDVLGPHEILTYNGQELLTWKTQENKGYVVQPYSSRVMRLKAVKK